MALEKNEGDNEISSKALIVGGNVGGLRDFCNIKSIKEGNIEPGESVNEAEHRLAYIKPDGRSEG